MVSTPRASIVSGNCEQEELITNSGVRDSRQSRKIYYVLRTELSVFGDFFCAGICIAPNACEK